MLLLRHVRNWSYETPEREVRASLVYRGFCRLGMEKAPDAKTLAWLRQLLDRGSQTTTPAVDCAGSQKK